ncbi:hypothetical protein BH23CHL2_BH23CHL2_00030 [soil metagenome]
MDAVHHPPPEAASQAVNRPLTASGIAPGILTVLLIVVSAIALNPERTATPFISSQSRAYFVVAALSTFGLIAWLVTTTQSESIPNRFLTAHAFLLAGGTALVIIERTSIPFAVLLLALAALYQVTCQRRLQTGEVPWSVLHSVFSVTYAWLAIAGLSSFQLQGRFAVFAAGVIALAGAVAVSWKGDRPGIALPLLGVVTVAGAEFELVLSFVLLSPFTSATIWLAGIGLAFGLTTFVELRVNR